MWSVGKKEMERKVKNLNDQLIKAQTQRGIATLTEFYHRKFAEFEARSKAKRLEKELASEKAETLELRENSNLKSDLKIATALQENVHLLLQKESVAHQELKESFQAQLKVQMPQKSFADFEARSKAERLEKELGDLKIDLKIATDRQENVHLLLQKERIAHQELKESFQAQLKVQMAQKSFAEFEARFKAEHLENELGDLKIATDLQENVHLLLQKERIAHQKLKESFQAQLKVQMAQKSFAEFEACSKAERLEKELASEKAETLELRRKVSAMEDELLKQREVAKKTLGQLGDRKILTDLQGNLQFQLQKERTAHQESKESFQARLDQQLNTERSKWVQEKAYLLEEIKVLCVARLEETMAAGEAQLKAQREKADSYATSLEKVKEHFEGFREWREEKSSLLQATEELKQTLQQKEAESGKKEAVLQDESVMLKTRVDFLERQIADKKKRKWYRRLRLNPCIAPDQVPDLLVFEEEDEQENAG